MKVQSEEFNKFNNDPASKETLNYAGGCCCSCCCSCSCSAASSED